MRIPFVGSAAVAAGRLTEAQLRHRYRAIYRGVYVPRQHTVCLHERIAGASLTTGGVIAGVAASALHGAQYIDDDIPVEVVAAGRRQRGLIIRYDTLAENEVTMVASIPVTTPGRTAFDLARRLPRNQAVERLDALMNARAFSAEDVALIAKHHPGVRGLRRLGIALPLVDGGAESPRETWLRLLFVDAGLPRPCTQFVVVDEDGSYVRRLDMCWEEFKVAEYDGEQHLTSRRQYTLDVQVGRRLQRLGWHVIHVIKEDHGPDIVEQARAALLSRGWTP
ncbi:type IV toxin-antitoxin system AbiEi family antitoxin [Mycobacterium sp. NPDC003449]